MDKVKKEKTTKQYFWHNRDLIKHIENRISLLRITDKQKWLIKLDVLKCYDIDQHFGSEELTHEIFKRNNENLLLLDYKLGEAHRKEDNYFDCIKIPLIEEYGVDDYKEEYPEPNVDIQTYYLDQSSRRTQIGDRVIASYYTLYGVKGLESFYSKEILYSEFKVSNEDLEKAIKRQPNLHNIIKTNLLNNLKSRIESGI